jgi:signal transduction histidine kinase
VSAVTIVASILLFSDGVVENRIVGAMPYLFALPLAWVTLRWSLRSAATLFTVVITIATAGTIAGAGPFNALGITAPLTALGIMIVLCAINILLIAALVSERRDMLARLALANRELERRVEARTRDLEAARRTAEQANAAKSRFLANVTHELRTPLNGVIGFADALQLGIYGDRPDPRYREAAGLIERSGRHLLALVDALLDMAKIEAGRFELDPTAIDLAALAREVIAVVTPMATERQVTLASELPAGVAPMLGDERAMRQILFNLLSNAIKFTRTEGRVSLSLSEQAGRIALSIADTGVGMDEGQLAIALEPFGRVDNAETHADRSGTGLGLPLSKALTEAQGGTFDVVSAPGRGTIVRMAFPRAG